MGRVTKTITFILSTLLLIFVTGAIALLMFIDPNQFKEPIEKRVQSITGRSTNIQGNLSWSFLPTVGLRIEDLNIANPQGFKQTTFLHIDSLDVRIKLFPLLKKQLQLGKIILNSPKLNLIRNEQGETNWHFTKSTALPTDHASSHVATSSTSQPMLGKIQISDATLYVRDTLTHQVTRLSIPKIKMEKITKNQPFAVNFQFKATQDSPAWTSHGTFKTKVLIQKDNLILHNLNYASEIKLDADTSKATDFNFYTNKLTYDWHTQRIDIGKLKGNLANMPFTLTLQGNTELTGNLHIPAFDLTKWFNHFSLHNPLNTRYGNANLALTINHNQWQFNLSPGVLDDMHIQGKLIYTPQARGINFDLKADTLKINRPSKRAVFSILRSSSPSTTNHKSLHTLIPWLRDYNINGEINIAQLQVGSLASEQVHTQVKSTQGQLQLDTHANFYEGTLKKHLLIDLNSSEPQYRLESTLEAIELKPFFQALHMQHIPQGKGFITTHLTSYGEQITSLQQHLQGDFNLKVNNGTIEGFDLINLLNQAAAVTLKTGKSPKTSTPSLEDKQTNFSSLVADWDIEEGIAHNNNLLFQSPLFYATGRGSVNLIDGKLAYYLTIKTLADQLPALTQLEKLVGGDITVKFSCTLMKPCHELKLNINSNTLLQNVGEILQHNRTAKNTLKLLFD